MRPSLLFLGSLLIGGLSLDQPHQANAAPGDLEVQLGTGSQALFGTFVKARREVTAYPVLILAGSGPTDRNGDSPLGISAQPYRLLAEELAAHGVSTLRIDKRGIGASAPAAASEESLRIETYAEDARSWAKRLREDTNTPCVWLLGHSEGALHALIAARDDSDICGLVLVAPMGRKAGDVLREQLMANPANAPILDEALAALDKLETGQPVSVEGMNPVLLPLFRPSVQPYLMSLLAADPVKLVRDFTGPVLVVQGTTDLQTSLNDARRLSDARPGIKFIAIEGMNHIFKTAPADTNLNLETYTNPLLPISPGLTDAIVKFIKF